MIGSYFFLKIFCLSQICEDCPVRVKNVSALSGKYWYTVFVVIMNIINDILIMSFPEICMYSIRIHNSVLTLHVLHEYMHMHYKDSQIQL